MVNTGPTSEQEKKINGKYIDLDVYNEYVGKNEYTHNTDKQFLNSKTKTATYETLSFDINTLNSTTEIANISNNPVEKLALDNLLNGQLSAVRPMPDQEGISYFFYLHDDILITHKFNSTVHSEYPQLINEVNSYITGSNNKTTELSPLAKIFLEDTIGFTPRTLRQKDAFSQWNKLVPQGLTAGVNTNRFDSRKEGNRGHLLITIKDYYEESGFGKFLKERQSIPNNISYDPELSERETRILTHSLTNNVDRRETENYLKLYNNFKKQVNIESQNSSLLNDQLNNNTTLIYTQSSLADLTSLLASSTSIQIKQTANQIKDTAKSAATTMITATRETANSAIETVATTIDNATTTIGDVARQTANTAKETAKSAATTVVTAARQTANSAKKTAINAKETAEAIADYTRETAKSAVETVGTAAYIGAKNTKETAITVVTTVENAARQTANSAKETAKNAKETAQAIADYTRETAKSAVETVGTVAYIGAGITANQAVKTAEAANNTAGGIFRSEGMKRFLNANSEINNLLTLGLVVAVAAFPVAVPAAAILAAASVALSITGRVGQAIYKHNDQASKGNNSRIITNDDSTKNRSQKSEFNFSPPTRNNTTRSSGIRGFGSDF